MGCEGPKGFVQKSAFMSQIGLRVLLGLMIGTLAAAGCKKKSEPEGPGGHTNDNSRTLGQGSSGSGLFRVHWVGRKQIAVEAKGTNIPAILALPQTHRLEEQTITKLAVWITESLSGSTNASAEDLTKRISALLQDVYDEQSIVEAQNSTGGFLEVKLAPERHAAWETNLSSVLLQCGWSQSPSNFAGLSWTSKQGHTIGFERSGAWSRLDFGSSATPRKEIAFSARSFSGTNLWLEARFDKAALPSSLLKEVKLLEHFKSVYLKASPLGGAVETSAKLEFEGLPDSPLPPWNIPTNLIRDPLLALTAIRGSFAAVPGLRADSGQEAITEAFYWSQASSAPFMHYAAAPVANASNFVYDLSLRWPALYNPWILKNATGRLVQSTNFNGINWKGLPMALPFLKSVSNDFIYAGIFPNPPSARPMPEALAAQFMFKSNLVFYSWEFTGPQLRNVLPVASLMRIASHHAMLPPDSASISWLRTIEPMLQNCATHMVRTGPGQFELSRVSTIGVDSWELTAAADWLESPRFPFGIYSMARPLAAFVPPPGSNATNSTPLAPPGLTPPTNAGPVGPAAPGAFRLQPPRAPEATNFPVPPKPVGD
jgi:hypothetical protein